MKEPKKKKSNAGRKKVVIDWDRVDKSLIAGSNGVQCAAMLGVHPDTLYNKCKEVKKMDFSAYRQAVSKKDIKTYTNEEKKLIEKENRKKRYLQQRLKTGYVYLINCEGSDFYKIGVSKIDIKNRLSTLQTGCPFKLKTIHTSYCNHYSLLESELHKRYKKYKVRGEWFELSKSLVLCVMKDMNEQMVKQLKLFK